MTDPHSQDTIGTSELMRRAAITTITVIVVIGLVLLFWRVRTILLWVLIGIILAVALQPVVDWLTRHRVNRVLAALAVSLVTIVVIVGAIVAIAWPVVLQSGDFVRNLPHIVDSIFARGGQLYFLESRFHVLERLSAISPSQVAGVILGNQQTIVGAVTKAASVAVGVITVLTIMVMMLIEGPRAWGAVLASLVDHERGWAERIGENFLRATGGYVRGNLAISLVAGIASYIVLKILGIPYAETLAVLVAILDVVPLVGATIGAVIVCIVGFASGGATDGIILVVFFVAYQQFENNVLQNMVYSRTVSLSPLVVFIAALIGAALGGIVGVLLAIPLTSAGWVLARDLIALRKERHSAGVRESAVKPPPPGAEGGGGPPERPAPPSGRPAPEAGPAAGV